MAFNWFKKLKNGLSKSAAKVQKSITAVVGKKTLDQETLNELEDQLIMADLGLRSASQIVEKLKSQKFLIEKDTKEISESKVFNVIANEISKILQPCEKDLFQKKIDTPCVLLLSGVNGSGKTTTAGKISEKLRKNNKKVVIAACDTFRAAAVSQLEKWAERTGSIFVKGEDNSDPAAVAYKSMELSIKEKADYLIIDTAGRLQNKKNLMEEYKKIANVTKKIDAQAPHDVVLVLDATSGQNIINQVEEFNKIIPITGIIMTKLDGTAKGGILLALAKKYKLPIIALGLGEKEDDLQIFEAEKFADAFTQTD